MPATEPAPAEVDKIINEHRLVFDVYKNTINELIAKLASGEIHFDNFKITIRKIRNSFNDNSRVIKNMMVKIKDNDYPTRCFLDGVRRELFEIETSLLNSEKHIADVERYELSEVMTACTARAEREAETKSIALVKREGVTLAQAITAMKLKDGSKRDSIMDAIKRAVERSDKIAPLNDKKISGEWYYCPNVLGDFIFDNYPQHIGDKRNFKRRLINARNQENKGKNQKKKVKK